MLVGYQRMGKTTLLSRLREVHEKVTPLTTFIQRVTGEEPAKPKKGRAGQWVWREPFSGCEPVGAGRCDQVSECYVV